MSDLGETMNDIRNEIGNTPDSGINAALYTRGEHFLSYGCLEANVEVNSRTVYVDLSYAGSMTTREKDAENAVKNSLGISIEELRDIARTEDESGGFGYMWTLELEIPTTEILNLTNKESINS